MYRETKNLDRLANRSKFLVSRYTNVFKDEVVVERFLKFLTSRHQPSIAKKARHLCDSRSWKELASHLLDNHYDPSYERSMSSLSAHTMDHNGYLANGSPILSNFSNRRDVSLSLQCSVDDEKLRT